MFNREKIARDCFPEIPSSLHCVSSVFLLPPRHAIKFIAKFYTILQEKCAEKVDELKRHYDEQLRSLAEKLAQKEAAYQSLIERHHNLDTASTAAAAAAAIQLKPLHTAPTARGGGADDANLAKRVAELEMQVLELREEVGWCCLSRRQTSTDCGSAKSGQYKCFCLLSRLTAFCAEYGRCLIFSYL